MPNFISIPNVIGNFYGGQPYAVDLSINFNGPTTLKVSLFNETGEYGTPIPNYSSTETILIGSLKFIGYLVECNIKEEASSKILELEYEDCSAVLDTIFVGLHKRHGINIAAGSAGINSEYFIDGNTNNNNVIIVGHEILNPIKTAGGLAYGGYSVSHVHDVGYYFNELLQKLGLSNVFIPNVNYVQNYSGNLRDVLNSWCADYGLTYYWELGASTIQSGLKFFDIKNIIRISEDIVNNCEITEKSIKVSAKGTIAQGEVAYYQREGGPVNYSTPPKLLTLECLTIGDLYNNDATDSLSKYTQLAIALSYYSQSLRDLLYWFNYRKLTSPERLLAVGNNELKEFALSNVAAVYSSSINSSNFNTIKNFGSDNDTIGDKADKLSSINGLEYYFFIARYNEEQYKGQLEGETQLANEFLGRHWIRSFDAQGRKSRMSAIGPGMQVEYIDNMASVPTLAFANFGHQPNTYIGNLVKEGQSSVSLTRSIIYGQRDGMWYPNKSDTDSYKDIVDYYNSMAHRIIEASYDDLFNQLGLDSNVHQENGYGLFIAFIRKEIQITSTPTNNFLDQTQMTPAYAGDSNNTIIGYYGLKSNRCYWVTFDGFRFMAPCGALMDVSNNKPSLGGSFVCKVGEEETFEFVSRKTQYSNVNIPNSNGVAKINVNFNDVSGDDVSQIKPFLVPKDNQEAADIRGGEIADVKSYVNNALNKTAFIQKENSKYIEFTLAGLPNKAIKISDGLDSLSIRVDDNGVFAQYAYSDKLIKAQEAQEVRKLRNLLINYNNLNQRYPSMLEKNVTQDGFIQST